MTVTLFMVVSRNGVYAVDGSTDISGFSSHEDREFFLSSLRSFDACIMGARSCSHEVPVKRKYVLTHDDLPDADERTTVLSGTPAEVYERIRADGNKRTALIGGAVTDIGFLEAGLVDEMFITVEPVNVPDGLVFDYGPYLDDFTLEEIIPLNETGTKVFKYEKRRLNMENEPDRLRQAKMFMEYLAAGIDPVKNTDADADTLHNEEIISCLRYVSEILDQHIYHADTGANVQADFYITEKQLAELKTFEHNCKVSGLANEINRVTAENGTKKMSATWINDWLEDEGYLYRYNNNNRIATEKGRRLGITSERRTRDNGVSYYVNLHNEEAQRFIYGHIAEIIAYRNERAPKPEPAPDVRELEFPYDISVRDFIAQQPDKCFILSFGSCDSVAEVGSYISALTYKGKSKVLTKSNIPTGSSNKCILSGILDAASAIKAPTEVVILSSVPLGFNSPGSKNYALCQEIYHVLEEKGCQVLVSVCRGKGAELSSLVRSFT
ncbi:MAG: hypothetical protein K6G90_07430 [Clostridia bacterium]|nr:hypothetical protein [Clostridia bacterium]